MTAAATFPRHDAPLPRAAAGRRRLALALALGAICLLALALRLPGVTWGAQLEPGVFHELNPDEGVGCLDAMTPDGAWLRDPANLLERGMQVDCWLAARVAHLATGREPTPQERITLGRGLSVAAGVACVLVFFAVGSALGGTAAGLLSALFLATSGVHLATSFFARGQVQASLLAFGAVAAAQRARGRREVAWLALAGFLAGGAVGYRFYVVLAPMLLVAALVTRRPRAALAAAAGGGLVGFAVLTGLQWDVAGLVRFATSHLRGGVAGPASAHGPVAMLLAVGVSAVAGSGLGAVVAALAPFARGRRAPAADAAPPASPLTPATRMATWRARLASPWTPLVVPVVLQTCILAGLTAYFARYADTVSLALCPVAGFGAARVLARWRRVGMALVAAVALYQVVYAAGVAARYTDESRGRAIAAVSGTVPDGATVATTPHIPSTRWLTAHAPPRGTAPWQADWLVASDIHVSRYLAANGGLRLLGAPASCASVWLCESEEARAFYQGLWTGARSDFTLAGVYPAPAWTPELWLYRATMGSRWCFTGDVRVFRRHGGPDAARETTGAGATPADRR